MLTATDILAANLSALRQTDPALAERLSNTPAAALDWAASRQGPLSASIQHEGRALTLASRYDPVAEAGKLLSPVDHQKHAGFFLLGMGLGYHVAELAGRMGRNTLLVVFEPDVALLRAVLEKIDHTAWLGRPNVILVAGQAERPTLLPRLEHYGAILTQGTVLITHPPTRQRFAAELATFGQLVADILAYCRTNVATALVNSSRTVRNLCNNLALYVAGTGTDELLNAAKGFPAVCVGAGPSLARNVALLADPAVRRHVVVISAQTTLKPLLDRGIQPDFVTALDYHEISRRFYEGLPPLPTVTLVAEPKANAAILDAYPGPIRVTWNRFLTRLLGDLAPKTVPIQDGATVAHLSFYLAQHLGCDPIILIGQDLGFSDGLYYCPGTAIHDVWAPELSPFNTLEMLEWQRIVRHRGNLKKLQDVYGAGIYSDEQMLTYLKQFERDFAKAPQKVIDASEGGLPKEHTTRLPLREALAQYATRPVPPLPLPPRQLDARELAAARRLLGERIVQIEELRALAVKTVPLLQQLLEHQRDGMRAARLFKQIETNRQRVRELDDAFGLVNELNSIGAFKRARADRAIAHAAGDDWDKQAQQVRRDLENLDWLTQACDEALDIFREGAERMETANRP